MVKKKNLLYPCLILLLLSFTALSFSQGKNTLKKIVISKGEKTLEVTISLSLYTYHRQFKLHNPDRICIDFFDIKSIKASHSIQVNERGIISVRVSMFKPSIARVVFDVTEEIPPYKTETIEEGLRVIFWPEEEPEVIEEKIQIDDAICDIKVDPSKANLNDPISVDMAGSQHVKSIEVEVFDPEGAKIASKELLPDSPKWEVTFDKPGEYVFKGKAFNIEGKPSENPCETKTYINFPPISRVECMPCEENIGKPITLDASGSADPDGEVVKVDFGIADEEGNLIDRFADTEKPFTWEKIFEKKGVYSVTAVVTDDFGAVSDPARVKVIVKQKRLFFLFDIGSLAARGEGTYVGYAAGRVGLLYKVFPGKLDIILSGGGAYTPVDDPWKSFFTANLLFSIHLGPVFIGAGGGFTTRDKKSIQNSYGELIANIGFDIFDTSKTTGSIFFEALGPVVDLSFQNHHKMMLGFRLLF